MDAMEIVSITGALFLLLIYLANLAEALESRVLKNILTATFILYTLILIFIAKFRIEILFLILSILVVVNRQFFEVICRVFKMNLQWKFLHKLFLGMSFYVLLNPIFFIAHGGKLMIILGIFGLLKESAVQLTMAFYSFIGIGLGTRRRFKECIERLDLKKPDLYYVFIGVVLVCMIDFVVWNIPYILSELFFKPEVGHTAVNYTSTESYYVREVVETIKQHTPSLFERVALCIIVGVGEELLFRGALQPRFGNLWTSLLFASMHYQYLSVITLIDVFLISYALGIIKNRSNTSTTILIHTIYDLLTLI